VLLTFRQGRWAYIVAFVICAVNLLFSVLSAGAMVAGLFAEMRQMNFGLREFSGFLHFLTGVSGIAIFISSFVALVSTRRRTIMEHDELARM
jgi:hypothetical protein